MKKATDREIRGMSMHRLMKKYRETFLAESDWDHLDNMISDIGFRGVGDFMKGSPEAVRVVLRWLEQQGFNEEWKRALFESIQEKEDELGETKETAAHPDLEEAVDMVASVGGKFHPGIRMPDGTTYHPTGFEWLTIFAHAGCEWAVEEMKKLKEAKHGKE